MNRMWENIILPIINLTNPKVIVEVGSEKGINTKNILNYCLYNDSFLISIDPAPLFDVDKFKKLYGEKFIFFKELSLERLPLLKDFECILIDGDHNWYTVYNELKCIEKNFNQEDFPLIFLHDVSWPYARRDLYYNPDTIPSEFLHEYSKLGMHPDSDDLLPQGGLNTMLLNANEINTPKNGVLTAVEDFLKESPFDLEFHHIPIFFGLGIIHKKDDNLSQEIEKIVYTHEVLDLVESFYMRDRLGKDKRTLNYMQKSNQLQINLSNKEKEIDTLNDNVTYLIRESAKKDSEISDLSKELESFEDIQEKYDFLTEVNMNQRIIIDDLKRDLGDTKTELENKRNILSNYNSKLVQYSNDMADLNNAKLRNLDRINHLEEVNSGLTRDIAKLSSDYGALEEVNSGLTRDIAKLSSDYSNLEEAKRNIIVDLNSLNEEMELFKDDLAADVSDLNLSVEKNIGLENGKVGLDEIKRLRVNQNFFEETILNMGKKIQELSDLNENQLKEFNQLNDDYNSIKNKNNLLNEEKNQLSNDLDSLLNSRSWRLTSVFRKAKHKISR